MRALLEILKGRSKRFSGLSEDGFTVLELIIVVVVIGILASIAVPIFTNQVRGGVEATLKSDIRNAAMVIMTEASKNQGRMPQWLPNYATKSPDNIVTVVTDRSNQYVFCLMGQNPNTITTYYYSSVTGEIGETACPSVANGGVGGNPIAGPGLPVSTPTTNQSWEEQKAIKAETKKAIYFPIVHAEMGVSRTNAVRQQIENSGHYGEVRQVTQAEFLAIPDDELIENYHTVITYHNSWSTPPVVVSKLNVYYNNGGKVLQDGNDNQTGFNPFIDTFIPANTSSGRLSYEPTKNTGLSPSFAYTFSKTSYYNSDSGWRCITGLTGGGVAIAEAQWNGNTCIVSYAGNNSNDGRWFAAWRFMNLSAGHEKAALDWLNS